MDIGRETRSPRQWWKARILLDEPILRIEVLDSLLLRLGEDAGHKGTGFQRPKNGLLRDQLLHSGLHHLARASSGNEVQRLGEGCQIDRPGGTPQSPSELQYASNELGLAKACHEYNYSS